MIRLCDAHPDLELGVPRGGLVYNLALPPGGLGERTGVIFYIHGFGQRFDDPYAQSLLPHLAETYDAVAVAVDYHGAVAQNGYSVRPAPDFFLRLKEHHGVSVTASPEMDMTQLVQGVLDQMAARGVTRLNNSCMLLKDEAGYINFGLLPAIDHLTVLHQILATYPVDRRRIFVIGTSYGGYVASLLTKVAPNSFRMVVDNSGYSGPGDTEATVYGLSLTGSVPSCLLRSVIAFSPAEGTPAHFDEGRRLVRELGVAEHYRTASATTVYAYHSASDVVAPTANKQAVQAVLARMGRRYDLRIITSADVDGRVFKSADHAMGASMRGLFALSHQRWLEDGGPGTAAAVTDFDLGTEIALDCAGTTYRLRFGASGPDLAIDRR